MADCEWYQISCRMTNAVSEVAGQAAGGIIKQWADGMLEGLDRMLAFSGAMWMKVPAPVITGSDGVVGWVHSVTGIFTLAIAVGSLIFAGIQLMVTQRGDDLRRIAWGLMMTVAVSGTSMAVMSAAISAGDEFSTWVIGQATDAEGSFMKQLLDVTPFVSATGPGLPVVLMLLLFFVAVIANIIQAVLMMVRSAMLFLLLGMMPMAAAASVTGWGQQWLKKMLAWTAAFVLFKPVASLIYAIGIRMMSQETFNPGEDNGPLYQLIIGVIMLVMAAMSLPALVGFMIPAAAGMGGGAAFGSMAAMGASGASGAMSLAQGSRGGGMGGSGSSGGSGGDGPTGADKAASPGVDTTSASTASSDSGSGAKGADGASTSTMPTSSGVSAAAGGAGAAGASGATGAAGAAAGGAGSAAGTAAAAGAGAATGGVATVAIGAAKGIQAAGQAAQGAVAASNDAIGETQ